MLGLGIGHLIVLAAYFGFWVMCLVSLTGRPLWGLYYLIPFVPYRTFRDHWVNYPLGENMLTILVIAVIVGALFRGKRLPKSKLYLIWLVIGLYLYSSMWLGAARGNAPAPLWLEDINFVTWKDYMLVPLLFVASGLVVEDRKAVRAVIFLTAITLLFIDRSCILESMSRTWTNFDEQKRSGGPLAFGSNQTAAFLAQFAMFFWGFTEFVKKKRLKLVGYGLVAVTLFATMYTFSRAAYLAVLLSVLVLGIVKDRKLLVILGLFVVTWQTIVPTAVRERVTMTQDTYGQLEVSAQERIDIWNESWNSIVKSPILGNGYGTFQIMPHVHGLSDTHNWYVKVLVETGIIGLIMAIILFEQTVALSYRLFKRANDPLYRGLGLGFGLAMCSCIIANLFGDRWTYLEISGPLWILAGAGARAVCLMAAEPASELTSSGLSAPVSTVVPIKV
jgi:O-antigen ligase